MSLFRQRKSLFTAAASLTIFTAGCGSSGPELSTVEGTVILDGKPVPDVLIEFQPDGGKGSPSVGYTDADGRYELRFSRDRIGALPGEHTVRINHDYDPGSDAPRPTFKIPAEYNVRSQLKREVARGSNTIDFELTSRLSNAQARR